MTIAYSKNFLKQTKKLDPALRSRTLERIRLFAVDPLHPQLRDHALKGTYKNYRSIDIAGDLRALYIEKDGNAVFDHIGTHAQLYG